ncbi:hypothetical protein ACXPWS_15430 [Mycobacterium sp. BMJ-28]
MAAGSSGALDLGAVMKDAQMAVDRLEDKFCGVSIVDASTQLCSGQWSLGGNEFG